MLVFGPHLPHRQTHLVQGLYAANEGMSRRFGTTTACSLEETG